MKGFITSNNAGYIQATGFYGMQTNLWQAICGGTETILMATGIKHVETSLDTSSLAKHVVVIHLTWF